MAMIVPIEAVVVKLSIAAGAQRHHAQKACKVSAFCFQLYVFSTSECDRCQYAEKHHML